MRRLPGTTFLICLAGLAAEAQDHDQLLMNYADLVLNDGQVLTVDAEFSVAEAIAVRDGRVLAVGDTEAMLSLAGPDTTTGQRSANVRQM